jgi:hypothetical protein
MVIIMEHLLPNIREIALLSADERIDKIKKEYCDQRNSKIKLNIKVKSN